MSKLRKLTIQEVNALNRFINSDRTSDKTKQAFINVLEKYKPSKEEENQQEIELQQEIDKLKN